MPNITDLPIELQSRILFFTPFITQLAAGKVCKLWSQILSTIPVQKSRYNPKVTTEGLPNLHYLLASDGSFRFAIQNCKIVGHKFWRFQGDKKGYEQGAWKKFNTEWLDVTDHPFLDEPAFSPFIAYNSRKISGELTRGPRYKMIFDNFHFEIDVLASPYTSPSNDYRKTRNRWADEGRTVREIVEEFAECIFSAVCASPKQAEDRVYDVVLTHGWRCWNGRWVGIMKGRLVVPEDRCKWTIDMTKRGGKKANP